MNLLKKISNFLSNITTIKADYIYLIIISLIIIAIVNIIRKIIITLTLKRDLNSREKYLYNKSGSTISNIIIVIMLAFVWIDYLKNFLTFITFISTAITLSIKDIIFNFFSGIYIRTSKIISLEDRIEIDGIKGDVVNMNKTSFDLLEIGDRVYGEQSTGRIIHIPNSLVFTYPVKNYVKAFKYIWDEIKVCVPLDSDIVAVKSELYEIIRKNNTVKEIPNKMEDEVKDASTDYRIYFNNLDPIIYTKVEGAHVELYLRFLVHPKKKRNIENSIWLDILKSNKEGKIHLYEKE